MDELMVRHEAIDHIRHYGEKDPNFVIHQALINGGHMERAHQFYEYRQLWEAVRQGQTNSKIPLFVTLACSDYCNLNCAHCYRTHNPDVTKRRRLELIEIYNVLDQCAELGVPSIGLGTESELFTYKEAAQIIQYASEKGFLDIFVFTNGLLLNEEHMDTILNSNVTRLFISIDAIRPSTYRTVRGKGYYGLMHRIFRFLEKRESLQKRLPILRVSFVDYNLTAADKAVFIDFWKSIADEVDIQSMIDIKNINQLRYDTIDEIHCDYPNNMLYINWNGDFKPCCSEFCKHLTIGNISEMSIEQAWNSTYMQQLRQQLNGKEPLNKVCLNCLRSLRSNEQYEPVAR